MWKYLVNLELSDMVDQVITVIEGTKILSAKPERDAVAIYGLVQEDAIARNVKVKVHVRLVFTGTWFYDGNWTFLDTVISEDFSGHENYRIAYHVFYRFES